MSQWSTDTTDRIHYSLLQCYYLPVNVHCLRDSLSVTEAPFVDFCMTKFRQNFLWRHLKENVMLKILAACHSGVPFQPGALRTCVPCLMVNPAVPTLLCSGCKSFISGRLKTLSFVIATLIAIVFTCQSVLVVICWQCLFEYRWNSAMMTVVQYVKPLVWYVQSTLYMLYLYMLYW